jgi:putative ABC transport system permease protein
VFSFLIAVPIAWYFMYHWLQGFAYRIQIGWAVFVLAGITAFLVAMVTVSFQAFRAAVANPAISLRTE